METTFFGNRARCYLLNTWHAATVTLTNGGTAFTCAGASAGDYVWLIADGIQFACQVGSGALVYEYKGVGGTSSGYYCTPETLAVLRGLDVTISYDVAELYGTDSILRVDEARHSNKVETKAKYAKWNSQVSVDWTMSILRPVGTGSAGEVENTNTCYGNGVVYRIMGTSGAYIDVVCGRTYWEGVPYPFPENDFVVRELTGHAVSATVNTY